jgi:hypothetical protein
LKILEWISTAVISAIVSAFVAFATVRLSNYAKDVVGEKNAWRGRVRGLTIEAVRSIYAGETQSEKYQSLMSEFYLLLNPYDIDDKEILKTMKESVLNPSEMQARKLLALVSRLLKHDWERAKTEFRLLSFLTPNDPSIRLLDSQDYQD